MQVKWSDILMMEHTINQREVKKNHSTQPHTHINSMTMKIFFLLNEKWLHHVVVVVVVKCCRNVCAKRYQWVKRETVTSLTSIILVCFDRWCLDAHVLVCAAERRWLLFAHFRPTMWPTATLLACKSPWFANDLSHVSSHFFSLLFFWFIFLGCGIFWYICWNENCSLIGQ